MELLRNVADVTQQVNDRARRWARHPDCSPWECEYHAIFHVHLQEAGTDSTAPHRAFHQSICNREESRTCLPVGGAPKRKLFWWQDYRFLIFTFIFTCCFSAFPSVTKYCFVSPHSRTCPFFEREWKEGGDKEVSIGCLVYTPQPGMKPAT